MTQPPLQPLHPDDRLITLKLEHFHRWATDMLIQSLAPGQPASLKVRPDGTMIDGHHRIKVLRERGIDVHQLPRDIIVKHIMEGQSPYGNNIPNSRPMGGECRHSGTAARQRLVGG